MIQCHVCGQDCEASVATKQRKAVGVTDAWLPSGEVAVAGHYTLIDVCPACVAKQQAERSAKTTRLLRLLPFVLFLAAAVAAIGFVALGLVYYLMSV